MGSDPTRETPRPPTGDRQLDEALRVADELRQLGLKPRDYDLGSPYGGPLRRPARPRPGKRSDRDDE